MGLRLSWQNLSSELSSAIIWLNSGWSNLVENNYWSFLYSELLTVNNVTQVIAHWFSHYLWNVLLVSSYWYNRVAAVSTRCQFGVHLEAFMYETNDVRMSVGMSFLWRDRYPMSKVPNNLIIVQCHFMVSLFFDIMKCSDLRNPVPLTRVLTWYFTVSP